MERTNLVVSQMLELHGRSTDVLGGSVVGLAAAVDQVVEQMQEMARSSGRTLHCQFAHGDEGSRIASHSLVGLTLTNIV